MRFQTISIGAGAADAPDPRANPELVPEAHVFVVPRATEGTDERPKNFGLTLEGTAGQDVEVTFFVLDQPEFQRVHDANSVKDGRSDRKWYQHGAAITVVVGTFQVPTLACVPGILYARTTGAPAAASVLKIACF